jgi:hypothetical protein
MTSETPRDLSGATHSLHHTVLLQQDKIKLKFYEDEVLFGRKGFLFTINLLYLNVNHSSFLSFPFHSSIACPPMSSET